MTFQSRNTRHRSSLKRRKVEGWKKDRAENWNSLSPGKRRDTLDDPSFVYITEDGEFLNGEDALRLWRRSCLENWPLRERKPILRSMNPSDRERILGDMNLVQAWRYSDNRIFKTQAAMLGWILLVSVLAFVLST